LDTVRARGLELFGGSGPAAPQLARIAQGGVIFERALAPSPWTLPSHASMFTGHWAHELSAGWSEPLDGTYPTLAEELAKRGYVTVGFVGNTMFATSKTGLGRGFVHYDDLPARPGQVLLSSSLGRALAGSTALRRIIGYHDLPNRRTAEEITDAFLNWQRRDDGRPFFAFVNFFDAHEPYFPPGYSGSVLAPGPRWTGYTHSVGLVTGPSAWIGEKWELTPEEVQIHASGYWAAVRSADAQFGRLLAELDRRGVLENTIVIIAGDHGEQLGEHGLFEHINSLYLPALQVPLVILPPGGPAKPVRVAEVVSLRDIPATVLDLLGEPPEPFPGRSLAPLWRGALDAAGDGDTSAPAGEPAFAHLEQGLVRQPWYPVNSGSEMFSLTTRDYHYIRNGNGSEELYDWGRDSAESVNLAGRPAADSILAEFRSALRTIVGSAESPDGARGPRRLDTGRRR
jgi:arylsulfatase A-like enzyme